MKLTLASRSPNYIRSYQADSVQVGEQTVTQPSIIAPDSIEAWPVESVDSLSKEHLAAIFALKPEVVILATGSKQQFPAPAIHGAFLAREIGFEVMEIGAACRTFNVLLSEDRHAVLALLFG